MLRMNYETSTRATHVSLKGFTGIAMTASSSVTSNRRCLSRKTCLVSLWAAAPIFADHRKILATTPSVGSGFDLLDRSSSAEIRVSIMVMAAPE